MQGTQLNDQSSEMLFGEGRTTRAMTKRASCGGDGTANSTQKRKVYAVGDVVEVLFENEDENGITSEEW